MHLIQSTSILQEFTIILLSITNSEFLDYTESLGGTKYWIRKTRSIKTLLLSYKCVLYRVSIILKLTRTYEDYILIKTLRNGAVKKKKERKTNTSVLSCSYRVARIKFFLPSIATILRNEQIENDDGDVL